MERVQEMYTEHIKGRKDKLDNSRPFSGGSSHAMFHSTCLDLVSPWANAISRACVYIAPVMESGRACTICPVHNGVFSPRITGSDNRRERVLSGTITVFYLSLDETQYSVGHLSESPEPSSL